MGRAPYTHREGTLVSNNRKTLDAGAQTHLDCALPTAEARREQTWAFLQQWSIYGENKNISRTWWGRRKSGSRQSLWDFHACQGRQTADRQTGQCQCTKNYEKITTRHVTGNPPLTSGPGEVGTSAPEATENQNRSRIWRVLALPHLQTVDSPHAPEGLPPQPPNQENHAGSWQQRQWCHLGQRACGLKPGSTLARRRDSTQDCAGASSHQPMRAWGKTFRNLRYRMLNTATVKNAIIAAHKLYWKQRQWNTHNSSLPTYFAPLLLSR